MAAIIIHESVDDTGQLVRTRLSSEAGLLSLVVGEVHRPLPDGALEAVMKRFGKPLAEPLEERAVVERLALGDERSLVRFRFMARYDVIARDYLAFYAPESEPLCELATSVTAVLEHLARSFAAASAG